MPDKNFQKIRSGGYVPYSGLTSTGGITETLVKWTRFKQKKGKNKLVLLDVYPYETNRHLLFRIYDQLPGKFSFPSKILRPGITSQRIAALIKKIKSFGAKKFSEAKNPTNIVYDSTRSVRKLLIQIYKQKQLTTKRIFVSPRHYFHLSKATDYKIPTISLTPLPLYFFQLADERYTPDLALMSTQVHYYWDLLLLADKKL